MNYLFSHGYLNFCFPFQANISCKEAADRLLMALTGLGIRETILFPLVKPTAGDE